MIYNVRIKVFPDGTKQYLYSENAKQREFKRMLSDLPDAYLDNDIEVEEKENERDVSGECAKRAKQRVWDIARANSWDYFFTLTLDPACVNRFDYNAVTDLIKQFTRQLHYYGCEWLIVPEQHKSGAWHFHGLLKGKTPMTIGKTLKDGTVLYNFKNYEFGFTSLSRINNEQAVATYLTKYLTKIWKSPREKRYWFSRGLNQPQFVYSELRSDALPALIAKSDFRKKLTSPYGDFWMLEVHSK